jgi:hypothetical protein
MLNWAEYGMDNKGMEDKADQGLPHIIKGMSVW